MNLWPVEHFFPQFGVPYSIQVPQIEEKSVPTSQRFICKEVTSYKIHALANFTRYLCNIVCKIAQSSKEILHGKC